MLNKTNEEINAFIQEGYSESGVFHDEDWYEWREIEVNVIKNSPDEVILTVTAMYDPPPLKLECLMAYVEFFGTTNVKNKRISHNGCDTCDWGSQYGYYLYVKPNSKS